MYNGAKYIRFTGSLTLLASASLVTPSGSNIITSAGDSCVVVPIGNPASGWRIASYERMALANLADDAVRKSTSTLQTLTGNLTSPTLTASTSFVMGAASNAGLTVQAYTGGSKAAIYSNAVTPGASNYSLLTDSVSTTLNASTSVLLAIGGTTAATITNTGINSTAIGATTPSTGAFTTLSSNVSGMTSPMTFGQFAGSTTYGQVNFNGGTTFAALSGMIGGGSGNNVYIAAPTGSNIQHLINGVGITQTSSTGLSVTGALSATGTASFYGASNGRINIGAANNYFYGDTAGNVIVGTNGADRMTIDSAGRMALNATSNNVGYFNSTSAGGAYISILNNSTNIAYIGNALALCSGSASDMAFSTPASNNMVFAIANIEKIRLDTSGNLLVGQTSGGVANSNSMSLQPAQGYSTFNHITGTASGANYHQFGYNGSAIGSISQSGTTAVLYNTTSDYRLKTVIASVSGAGDRIDALNPVEYEWKADGTRTRGFLAHEFQSVYAQSVNGTKDAVDADGNPVYQSMQAGSSEVIADLVAEIKSLRARLAAAGIA